MFDCFFLRLYTCLDRNLLVSYTIVDEMYNKHPKLVPDAFWDKKEPILPYTKSSLGTKLSAHPHMGSTVNLSSNCNRKLFIIEECVLIFIFFFAVEPEEFLPMETIMEEDHEDYNYSSPPTTSMVDYGNKQPNWGFRDQPSIIQMDSQENQFNSNLINQDKYLSGKAGIDDFSRNQSEIIENLRTESNQSSRCTGRSTRLSFLPDSIQESKIVKMLFGGSQSNSSKNLDINSSQNVNQYQNYSNLLRQHHQNSSNLNTFRLKTPIKKQQPQTNQQSTDQQQMSNIRRLNPASTGGNFNTSLSMSTVSSQNLSSSHHNLIHTNSNKNKLQSSRKTIGQYDDLTSSNDDQSKFEQTSNRNHRNLRLNRPSNQASSSRYCNLPTAPVLPTFGASNTVTKTKMVSPFMNKLRNSLNNFSTHQYRNLSRLNSRNKRNSFSSAISLKSKCDNPTSEQLVTQNGFHFPQSYIPPNNPHQYLPIHLQTDHQDSASILTLEQENELNNNNNDALNLNEKIEIKISPASQRASQRDLNFDQSLPNLNEEDNLIVMDDLTHKDDNEKKDKEQNDARETISKAASILKASNENEIIKLKSSVNKPIINNQDSVPLTSGTLTENQSSKSSSNHSSTTELNQEEENINENQSLINKNETTSSSSISNETTQTLINNTDQNDRDDQSYSPNEEPNEERYEDSPTNSNDSLSPYESNQNTISSYTQLLEKEKNSKE